MNRGLLALIVIIIIIIIGGVYIFSESNDQEVQNNTAQNVTVQNNTQNTSQTNNTSNTTQTNISSEQARQIALQFIDEPGAYPGTPTLTTWPDGRLVWNVPVIQNGQIVSGVVIDAQTGANLGKG